MNKRYRVETVTRVWNNIIIRRYVVKDKKSPWESDEFVTRDSALLFAAALRVNGEAGLIKYAPHTEG